jgi:hypothetical protein
MDLTKRLALLAAFFLAVVPAACTSTVNTNGSGCPDSGLPPEGSSCPELGQTCGQLDECGYGQQAVCTSDGWVINWYDPGPDECGCGVDCPPPPPTCPDTQPADGSACSDEGATCQYGDPSCNEAGADATCTGGAWSVSQYGPACVLTCPAALPVAGTPCDGCCLASDCAYLDATGCPIQIACENGVWVTSATQCTPTSACATLDMNACGSAQGCRWIALPGCPSSPQSFPQGCYPVDDCASDADCNGETCKAVEVDPCPFGDCNACTKPAAICVP